MTGGEAPMRWWGWGEPPQPIQLSGPGEALIRSELGLPDLVPQSPPSLEEVRIGEPALPPGAEEALRAAVGAENVQLDRLSRVRRAAGRSYPDLFRLRSGDASGAPDAVVLPGSEEEVAVVLDVCARERVAVVPFGGGTSVVGGVEALHDGLAAAIALDLGRLDSLTTDRRSLTATIGAGLPGRRAEARLQARGLTLGHFPQSFEYGTVGGYVATRSAGQASTGYGRVDKLVLGLRLVAPAGELVVKPIPASAAGPSLRELIVGSEGAFGVITEATLSVRPLPRTRRYEGWSFRSFDAGCEAFRALEHEHAAPDVARLSDEEETRLAMALSSHGGLTERAGKAYLRARGHAEGCVVIVGWEGEEAAVAGRAADGGRILHAHGGLALGRRPGRSWLRSRYLGPYLRDVLLGMGVLAETLETATTWSRLSQLHDAVTHALQEALSGRGTPPLVGCHVSHLYPAGASLYFTFMARATPGEELEQWRAAKEAASRAIVENGGTITHHHAVGHDHVPWMRDEVGELGVELLRAAKERLDPQGIMNPGKLIPE
ncbi:MAG: alkyldihydroxyacetonephosphate synthase [Thermoleophilaceae bacterium]|nr:alkyldihydroxyacetonephosphate synthase [Thermoleophilaceae bacterium]